MSKRKNDITKFFKPVSKTPKIDSNEQNTENLNIGLEVMSVIEENNENVGNQTDQIDSSPSDILDIKSKLVEEFMEKLASHGLKLNSTLDLVSSEINPSITIETEIEQPSEESKVEIVKQFRPPANFKFPSKKLGTGKNQCNRSCQAEWFEKWKFLHYTGYLIT